MARKKTWQKLIDQVLEGKTASVDLAKPYVKPSDVVDYLERVVGLVQGESERNGWQVDFWLPFIRDGGEPKIRETVVGNHTYKDEVYPFMFEGTWYYGTQCFRKNGE
jgi:hypothetical protein